MKRLFKNRKRTLRTLGVITVVVILGLYIGFPTVLAIATILPENESSGDPPDGFIAVTFKTEDGVQLSAWYAAPQNGAVIILVHGAGSGRDGVRSYATLLRDNGFGVLAVNMRGFGDSEGDINRLGWQGTTDIGAAIEYLDARPEAEGLGGLGISMGAEILLGASSTYPALKAVVSDGATYRSVDEYRSLPENRSLYRSFTHGVFTFMVGVLSGDEAPDPTLLASIEQASNTQFLFIAAGKDNTEIDYNRLFHESTADRSTLWIIDGVGHTGGFDHDPNIYERRVIDFFTSTLLVK